MLGDSEVVAAIAGDPEAQQQLGAQERTDPIQDSPEQDYSVLDADSSQRNAIDTVLAGRSLVIHGPPGTGKSQTIANLIAALVARGRKVLFVAEKRAAIDAVLSRLKGASLGEVVLDIHDGTRDRLRIARDLGDAMDEAQHTAQPDVGDLHRRLADRHRRLSRHVSALHQPHQPWGVTPFQVQSALLGLPAGARTLVRLEAPERIGREQADRIRDELREFSHLGGFTIRPGSTPWFGAALRGPEEARQACELAARLSSRGLPLLAHHMAQACQEAGLRPPDSYSGGIARMRLFAAARTTQQAFDAARVRGRSGAAGRRDRRRGWPGFPRAPRRYASRRGHWCVVRTSQTAARLTEQQLSAALGEAAAQLAEWQELRTDDGLPRVPAQLGQLQSVSTDCEEQLARLRAIVPIPADPEQVLADLAADQDTAWKLPRLYELGSRFADLGLGPLLDELADRTAEPDLAAATFDYAWYCSILDEIRVRDPRYAAHRGDALDDIAGDFRVHDVQHLTANRARVRQRLGRGAGRSV